jgi:hypothetical protein
MTSTPQLSQVQQHINMLRRWARADRINGYVNTARGYEERADAMERAVYDMNFTKGA